MSYTTNYTNEYGHTEEVSITEEDSAEALKNDYKEIIRKYNPMYVTIQRAHAKPVEDMLLKVTVKPRSHYLTSFSVNPTYSARICGCIIVYS